VGKHKLEDCGPGGPGIKGDSIFKTTRAKRAGGVAQVVPSKHEALSLTPTTAK
jgi:hypothetical protein